MTSGTKPRRKRFVRAPIDQEPTLTERDLSILNAILSYGGILNTKQVAMLFWPPAIDRKLRVWKLNKDQVQGLVEQYLPAILDEKVELLKFLLKVQRLSAAAEIKSGPYLRFWEWLMEMKDNEPAMFAELEQVVKAVVEVEPEVWLLNAIQQNVKPPQAFLSRPRPASEFVSRACTQRLRSLYDAGWLNKDEPSTKLHQGRGQTLWYLSKRARDYLARMRKVSVKRLNWKPVGSFGDLHLPHRLAINDFRISVSLAAARLGYELKKWRDETELRKIHIKQKITLQSDPDDPDSKLVERWLLPDSYFWLHTGDNWFHFVEIDKGTETLQYTDASQDLQFWGLKVRKHGQYYKQWYAQTYPEAQHRLRILVVTTSETRLENMARVTREVAGKAAKRYWLTTFDRIAPTYQGYFIETVLTRKIWQRADTLELHPLVW